MTLLARLRSQFRVELAGRLVAVVAGALLTVLLARLLGPDEYGLLFFAISILTALGIASKLGIAKSTARYVAEYKTEKEGQLPHILRFSLVLNLVTVSIVVLGLVVFHRQIAAIFKASGLETLLLIGALFVAFEALKTYARLVLQGFERIRSSALVHAVDQGCRLVFAIGFVLAGFGALGALGGFILGFVIATIVGFVGIYKTTTNAHSETEPVESGLRRRIAEYTVPLTATSTANVLDKQIDTVLVGFFLNPVAVSYYVISKQVVEFVETPVTALGFTLSPTFGAKKAAGDVERAARLYEEALSHSLLLYVPVAAGIVLTAEPAIRLVFGAGFLGAVPVLQVLALYAILRAITKLTSNGLDYLGRARERAIVKGTTAVANVGLNVALIPTIGVIGAAVATVITYAAYTFANVYIIHQEFDLRIGYLLRYVASVLAITGVMSVAVFLVVDYVRGPLSLLVVVAFGGVIWAGLSVLTGLVDRRTVVSAL